MDRYIGLDADKPIESDNSKRINAPPILTPVGEPRDRQQHDALALHSAPGRTITDRHAAGGNLQEEGCLHA
jgi:hypothetical protein